MIAPPAFRNAPSSRAKLAAYLAAMVAVAALSLAPLGPRPPAPVALQAAATGAQGALFDLLRFGIPSDEIRERLPAIGIPWFLRRAGVAGRIDATDPRQLVIALTWDDKPVGRYIERIVPIDADRSRLYVGFEASDTTLVARLATPIETTLDPLSLMRVTMTEHVRSSLDGGSFRLSVLRPGEARLGMPNMLAALRPEPARDSDDFTLDPAEIEAAAIRRAYRAEADRAGASASKL